MLGFRVSKAKSIEAGIGKYWETMESDGVASSSKRSGRSGGGGRSERSSSTQGVYVPTVGEERHGVAPKCRCGVYAIPYLSRNLPYCRFFMWLDEFTANIANEAAGRVGEQEQDVREQFGRIELEIMMHDLEERVAALEKKKFMNSFYVIAMLLASLCVYFVKAA
ncbi:hypothetical protein PIB30_009678 [Stylosanthes scabra]|uniref:Zinc finger GRF-type domain-containing protein n=1 Tax=Stylosanthes scabra TaxID=79078 RepID=A0ABU6U6T9_9FABA|nr:hypothetical protein [Stylosanthes scabra]